MLSSMRWGFFRLRALFPTSLCVVVVLSGCAVAPSLPLELRPINWAQPVNVDVKLAQGLPNLFRVSDILFRSAQPTVEGLRVLNERQSLQYGLPVEIRTVVNLRNNAGDEVLILPTGVRYEHITFNTWDVNEDDVVRFLKIVRNPVNQPVLLHCRHGSDRTGMMTAAYRIVEQGWSKHDAIAEMTQGGFGFHPIWQNLIRYLERMDPEAIRQRL